MGIRGVKPKVARSAGTLLLAIAALAAFSVAWTGILPARLVEEWYSRGIFPALSRLMAPLARGVSFSWLDVVLPAALIAVVWCVRRRKLRYVVALLSGGYLFFFLTWGLNYQRMPLVSKLDFVADRVGDDGVRALRREAALELNRLYSEKERSQVDDEAIAGEAALRVAAVVRELDGVSFPGPSVKTSRLLNPVFRAGGTAGMFNPFGQEALVTEPLLPVERPVIVMHEIAHVFGYAHEGDANFIAFLAAIHSAQPLARYSGWLYLWLYLRGPDADGLLDPGPLADLESIYERRRREQVEWLSRASDRTLDAFLRANRVPDGVRSYSGIVRLAVGTRPSWERFAGPRSGP